MLILTIVALMAAAVAAAPVADEAPPQWTGVPVREKYPEKTNAGPPAEEFPNAHYKSPGIGQVPLSIFSVEFQRPNGSDPVPWGARRQTFYLGLENQNADCWHPIYKYRKMKNPHKALLYLRGDELFLFGRRHDALQQVYVDRASEGRIRFSNRKSQSWMPREPIRRFDESPILTADPSGWWVDNGTLRYQDQETFDCVDLTMMNLLELRRFQHEMPQDKGRGYYPAVGYSAVGWGMAEGCEPRVARIIPEGNDTPCKYDFRPWTKSWPWDPVHPW